MKIYSTEIDTWNERYALAKQYYNNGNLFIPSQYISSDNIKLGDWISRQRKNIKMVNYLKNK